MNSKMDEFREFVNKHPLLKDDVRANKMTWQNVYEEWTLFGEQDENWKKYERQEKKEEAKVENQSNMVNMDSIKSIMNYVQKINPDSVNKTLNTVQKVIQIAQTFSGTKTPTVPTATSIYSDWWD